MTVLELAIRIGSGRTNGTFWEVGKVLALVFVSLITLSRHLYGVLVGTRLVELESLHMVS